MSQDKSMVECEICFEDVPEDELESHVVQKHSNSKASVMQKYEDIYENNKREILGGNKISGQPAEETNGTKPDTAGGSDEDPETESEDSEDTTDDTQESDPSYEDVDQIQETESEEDEVTEAELTREDTTRDVDSEDDATGEDPTRDGDSHHDATEDDTESSEDDSNVVRIEANSTTESSTASTQSDPTSTKRSSDPSAEPKESDQTQSSTTDDRNSPVEPSEISENVTVRKEGESPDEDNTGEDFEEDPADVGSSSPNVDGFLDDSTGQEKWFSLGVGGCGGNLIDALILRAKTLSQHDDHPLSNAWERAIRGLAVVNADADSELASTYFAQEYKDAPASKLADNYKIGPPEFQGSGNIEKRGAKFADWTLSQDEGDFAGSQWGDALSPNRIDEAQGVMLFHSAVKGTGTGATPTIAKSIIDDVLSSSDDYNFDFVESSSVFSSTILPSMGKLDAKEKRNGLVGMARLASEIDAIIPFDNNNLLNASEELRVPITEGDNLQMANHRTENEVLISFLETMSLTSAAPSDSDTTNLGEQVDVQDIYNPAKELLPIDDEELPAVVLAPIYGQMDPDGSMDRDKLEELIGHTFLNGKLVDFDHETAWGGAFLIAHSGEYDKLMSLGKRNFREIISKEEYLDFDPDGKGDMISTKDYYIQIPGLDGVRLCGLLYNPTMPRIEGWREWAEGKKGINNDLGKRLEEVWPKVDQLFNLLGRQNMPGYEDEP